MSGSLSLRGGESQWERPSAGNRGPRETAPRLQQSFQIPMGRGDDPDVHFDGRRPPHPFNLLFLQDPEQSNLGFVREVADFIEKYGAPVPRSKRPRFWARAPVKAPFRARIIRWPKRLQQVTTNLLSNGVKFTPNRGRITVSSRESADKIQIEDHS
jgi:signal transduction histidine kinase